MKLRMSWSQLCKDLKLWSHRAQRDQYFFWGQKWISYAKGQFILWCPYQMIVSSKVPAKLFPVFCPEVFCSFLGASWKFLGLPVGFLFMILLTKSPGSPKSFQEAPWEGTKNFRAEIISLLFWKKLSFHKDIMKD